MQPKANKQQIRLGLALLVSALLGLAFAQPPDRLYLDFTESDYEGRPFPVVHLYDNEALTSCIEAGSDPTCVDAALYRLYFNEARQAEKAVEELEQAYRDLRLAVAKEVDAEINNGAPCHAFMVCLPGNVTPPVPDLGCLLPRQLTGVANGTAKHLPTYIAEVNRIINTYLPNHIASGTIYPDVASVVAPTMDVFGGLEEIIGGLADIRNLEDAITAAYRTQSIAAMTGVSTYVPYLPGQVEYEKRAGSSLARPGYRDYEAGKRSHEELFNPDNIRKGIFGFGASSLSAHAPSALAGDITSSLASTTGAAAAQNILGEHLAGLVPQDVIDHLALRVQTTIDNATPGEDLEASITNALDKGISIMAPSLFTEEATATALAASLDWEAPTLPSVPMPVLGGDLSVSSTFIYEHVGYVGFTQITPDTQNTTLMMEDGFIPVPGMWVKCFGVVPTPLKIPIPTPASFPGVASAAYITVPEGYEIPRTPRNLTLSPLSTLLD